MRLNRVMMAALVAVLLGVGIWLAIAYWGRTSPPTAAQQRAAAQQDKQALVEGLAQGQILYIRSEDYSKVRLGPLGQRDYPQRVIDETWVVIGSDGATETSVGTMRDLDGDLIGYSELKDGVNTYSDLTSGVYFDMPMGIGLGYAEWVKGRLDVISITNRMEARGFSFVRQGELGNQVSLIFEQSYPAGQGDEASVSRLEFVEHRPFLMRSATYEVDEQGQETLLEEHAFLEYRLLPQGSTFPDIDVDLPTRSLEELFEQQRREEEEEAR